MWHWVDVFSWLTKRFVITVLSQYYHWSFFLHVPIQPSGRDMRHHVFLRDHCSSKKVLGILAIWLHHWASFPKDYGNEWPFLMIFLSACPGKSEPRIWHNYEIWNMCVAVHVYNWSLMSCNDHGDWLGTWLVHQIQLVHDLIHAIRKLKYHIGSFGGFRSF